MVPASSHHANPINHGYQRLGRRPRAFGGRFDAVYFDPGGGPGTGLLRRDADRARPRRRPLRARNLAAAFAGDHRRVLRPALLGSRGRGDPAVCRRRDFRRRSRPYGERSLCHVPPSRGGAARPDRSASIRAGAVSRPDPGVQGRRDAADLAADGSRAGPARAAHHHRGRDLRRYRGRRGRCVRGPRKCRSDRAVSAWPDLRRAAADDDDDRCCQRSCARRSKALSTIARRS